MKVFIVGAGLVLCGLLWTPMQAEAGCDATATPPTLQEGQQSSKDPCDLKGNKYFTLGTLIKCEDELSNVCRVETQMSYRGNLTADTQIKASAGFVHTLICQGTTGTATAGTIILYDNTAESGTQIYHWDVQAVALTTPVTILLDAVASTGLYLGYTTTANVNCAVTYR